MNIKIGEAIIKLELWAVFLKVNDECSIKNEGIIINQQIK